MALAADGSSGPYRHQPLVTALNNFYSTLSDLSYITPSDIVSPSSQTGMHAPEAIDAGRALSTGYNNEVIDLMYHLPYLSEEASDIQLASNTTKLSYLRQSDDEDGVFEDARDLFQGPRTIPSHMLVLTWGQVYGTFVVYDVQTGRVIPWEPMADDYQGMIPNLPTFSPEDFFGGWTAKYLQLEWLPLDLYGDINFVREGGDLLAPPGDYEEQWQRWWFQERARYETERTLRDLYLDCGWGGEFRKGEFEAKREQWREQVLEPMEERLLEGFDEMRDIFDVQMGRS